MFEGLNGNKNTYDLSHSFIHLHAENGPTVPLKNELEMYNAVHSVVIDSGIFYSSDVFKMVVDILKDKISPDELLKNVDKVEGGDFGMIIYYMRKIVEKNSILFSNLKAVMDNRIKTGLTIKNTFINSKKYANIIVDSVNYSDGRLLVKCSRRGTSKIDFYWIGANSSMVQDHLNDLVYPTGVSLLNSDVNGLKSISIDPSESYRQSLTYSAA